jgi:hypothetical protein
MMRSPRLPVKANTWPENGLSSRVTEPSRISFGSASAHPQVVPNSGKSAGPQLGNCTFSKSVGRGKRAGMRNELSNVPPRLGICEGERMSCKLPDSCYPRLSSLMLPSNQTGLSRRESLGKALELCMSHAHADSYVEPRQETECYYNTPTRAAVQSCAANRKSL